MFKDTDLLVSLCLVYFVTYNCRIEKKRDEFVTQDDFLFKKNDLQLSILVTDTLKNAGLGQM